MIFNILSLSSFRKKNTPKYNFYWYLWKNKFFNRSGQSLIEAQGECRLEMILCSVLLMEVHVLFWSELPNALIRLFLETFTTLSDRILRFPKRDFYFRWLKIKVLDAAFSVRIALFFNHQNCNWYFVVFNI